MLFLFLERVYLTPVFCCHFAKFIWRIVHVSFNLSSPTSIHNIFLDWLEGINRKLKYKIIVGASDLCWAIWLSRNDIVFNKTVAPSYLQAIFRGIYWTRFWFLLQKEEEEEDRQFMKMRCKTRQSRWKCSLDTAGVLVIKLLHSSDFLSTSFLLWRKTLFLRYPGPFLSSL
jgi:hypothetical protein